jgi:phospholipase C
MENRSFDHMLGYLKLEGGRQDVDGLTAGLSNTYNNVVYPIHRLTETKLGRKQDPCHSGSCVADQLRGGNGGFVRSYAATHAGDSNPGLVMGYFNKAALPTYDHIANAFEVCDQWYASVRGATWPNRLYALAGRAAGSKDNPKGVPKFALPSFVRHLDTNHVSWKWYAFPLHPIGGMLTTLQIVDDRYNDPNAGNYARCDPVFFNDAGAGRLPSVSWIDPDFGLPIPGVHQNDDHPPADVLAGQELALKVYHAVTQGPLWQKSLLIIVYDEHGGFYDHVAPPAAEDDDPAFRQYGVRVPALVVSPWVGPGSVSKLPFDHTSIIKTILLRFCQSNSGIPDMGIRVSRASHLGGLLSLADPRDAPPLADHTDAVESIAEGRADAVRAKFRPSGIKTEAPAELTDFQKGLLAASAQYAAKPTKPKKRTAPKKRSTKKVRKRT